MRVLEVELFRVKIPFKGSFSHALKERREADAVLVAVHGERSTGWGEIVPRDYLTGETIDSVLAEYAPARARAVLGFSCGAMSELRERLFADLSAGGRNLATAGGFELALIDLFTREHHLPAQAVLGEVELRSALPQGAVIGFEVATADLPKHCMKLRFGGIKHLKVKVGAADDVDRLAMIAKAFAGTALRLDANAAWTASEAIEKLSRMKSASLPVASIEQPIAAFDFAGLREIREKTGVRVMADESLCSEADARRLIEEKAVDIFNIRLGKCGGFLGSKKLVDLAREHGLGCHLGALVGETGVLSAAAEIFGRAVPVFDCLEGKGQNKFLLADDIAAPNAEGFGLGVEVDRAKIDTYLVTHTRFSGGNT